MLRDLFDDGLSISEIARQTGHDRKTISKYIKGESYRQNERRRHGLVQIDPKCMIKPELQNGKVLSIPEEISLP